MDFTWYLRNLLLLKSADNMEDVLDISTEHLAMLKEEAKAIEAPVLMRYIHIMSSLLEELKGSSQKRALLEVAMIRLMRPQMDEDYTSVIERLVNIEQQLESGVIVSPADQGEKPQAAKAEPLKKELPENIEETVKSAAGMWKRIAADADRLMKHSLNMAYVSISEDGRRLLLVYDEADNEQATIYKQLSQPHNIEILNNLVSDHVGAKVDIELVLNNSQLDRVHRYPDALSRFEQQTGIKLEEEDF